MTRPRALQERTPDLISSHAAPHAPLEAAVRKPALRLERAAFRFEDGFLDACKSDDRARARRAAPLEAAVRKPAFRFEGGFLDACKIDDRARARRTACAARSRGPQALKRNEP